MNERDARTRTSGDPISWRGLLWLRSAAIAVTGVGSLLAWLAFDPTVPIGWLLGLVGLWTVTQLIAARSSTTPGAPSLAGLMAFDVALLALVFHWTGGPSNPFTFLTLIYLALAAVVLPEAWAWAVGAWAAAAFGLLFLLPPPAPAVDHAAMGHTMAHGSHGMAHGGSGDGSMDWHMRGMWVGYVLAGAAILGFVGRIAKALADRDRELAEARDAAARSAQLASLATLAAGAAHELGTPLGTIAVVAKELERELTRADAPASAIEDARLIASEVTRCRDVLGRLRADAGDPGGEAPAAVPPADLVAEAISGLPDRVDVVLHDGLPEAVVLFPHTSADALRDLVRNALDATAPDGRVAVHAEAAGRHLRLRVVDEGPGMDAVTAQRAVEPFFTTKPAGQGMGLGLFLARTIAERTGGRLDIDSTPGHGTTVTLDLAPVSP